MTALPMFPKPIPRSKASPKPLERKAPLRAKAGISRAKPMRKGPSRRSLNRTLAAALYMRWVHAQPCVMHGDARHDCAGRVEQSHARNIGELPTGVGRKEDDFQSIPMCSRLHAQWEQHAGMFYAWSKEQRRTWMVARIAEHHLAYQLDGGVIVAAASRAERRVV